MNGFFVTVKGLAPPFPQSSALKIKGIGSALPSKLRFENKRDWLRPSLKAPL